MNKTLIIKSILIIGIISCIVAGAYYLSHQHPKITWQKENNSIAKLADRYGIKANLYQSKWVFFISVGGCGFCLGQILKFIEHHKSRPDYLFIIPTNSKKDFILDIPAHIRSQKNVIQDSLIIGFRDSLLMPTQNAAYRIEGGIVVNKIMITPDNVEDVLSEVGF